MRQLNDKAKAFREKAQNYVLVVDLSNSGARQHCSLCDRKFTNGNPRTPEHTWCNHCAVENVKGMRDPLAFPDVSKFLEMWIANGDLTQREVELHASFSAQNC